MLLLQQNEAVAARRQVFVQMVDAVDQVTPKPGLTLTVEMVRSGAGAYAAIAGSWLEVGEGTYRVDLAAADVTDLGQGMLKITAAGAANQYVPVQVVRLMDEVHLAKAALVNTRTHVVETGVNQIRDDDGVTVLRTMTPEESNGVVTVVSS